MGFFSDVDIEIRESIDSGASRYQIEKMYPFLSDSDIDAYFADECDYEYEAERQATGVELHDSEYEESYAASNEDDGDYYVSSLNDPFDEESVR